MDESEKLEDKVNSNMCTCVAPHLTKDPKRSEIFCEDCGEIVEEGVSLCNPEHEVTFFKGKVGKPFNEFSNPIIESRKLGSQIKREPKDGRGKRLNHKQRVTAYRMQKRVYRENALVTRIFQDALNALNGYCARANVPKYAKIRATKIIKDIQNKNLLHGRTLELAAVTSVRIALDEQKMPRFLSDLVENTSLEKRYVSRYERLVRRELNLLKERTPLANYLQRVFSKIDVTPEIQANILNDVYVIEAKDKIEGKIKGRSPISVISAVIYHNVRKSLTQEQIEKKVGVLTQAQIAKRIGTSEVSLRNTYKVIKPYIEST
jgi:transcription initiation factor TFIIIB Brf1 subunit/transcription initiation factor TFIIB